jgi:uncharacterized protein YjiS (DUF1127 family)
MLPLQTIGAIFGRWRERRRRRAAIRELRALDNRTLKDMGLTRGEIVAAVDGLVWGREPVRDEPKRPAAAAPVAAIEPVALQGQLDRARQLRAEFVAGLLRRGVRRLVRLLRRAAHRRAHPMPESRHGRCSNHAA